MHNRIDITGVRSGLLVAKYATNERENGCILWYCECDCGGSRKCKAADIRLNRVRLCGRRCKCKSAAVKPKRKETTTLAANLILRSFNDEFSGGTRKDKIDPEEIVKPKVFVKKSDAQKGLEQARLYTFGG